ncbi:MAG: bifunctional diaminohydroxyphosphoribosylaminopyrimidine deaminase/5-amino-6-(5-phosphoribosylamino)uracil reductase RibD [Chloroflexi bacterium]|nr:bifunctional diaminohydroxyphosphoribosylaminopyrimidine deaminase/5-amino-6-(5-phosphoribosylamino)uracil reductase RibD [Chloroflexota bacterium]
MRRALELARMAQGRTSPNPPVGAVVVNGGRIVGEGHTQPAGSWHAEVVALRQAGYQARGASLYVTLEPCCHHGRTPPCTKAIIEAGVATVHVATIDPNQLVDGKGLRELEAAGVEVVVGEAEADALEVVEAFATYVATGLPFFTLKWAMSLDGKIAAWSGDSKWITCEAARAYGHELRDTSDAIMVGVNTIAADNSQLTVRLAQNLRPARPSGPLRVVVDSTGRIPPSARVLAPDLAIGTVVATTQRCGDVTRRVLEERGAEVLVLPERQGRVDLRALALALAQRGVVHVLVEGGGTLIGALLDEGLGDKIYSFVAPVIIGGRGAPGPVGGEGVERIAQAFRLRDVRVERVSDDLLVVGYIGNALERSAGACPNTA